MTKSSHSLPPPLITADYVPAPSSRPAAKAAGEHLICAAELAPETHPPEFPESHKDSNNRSNRGAASACAIATATAATAPYLHNVNREGGLSLPGQHAHVGIGRRVHMKVKLKALKP